MESTHVSRPDVVIVVIDFGQLSTKHKTQVNAKEFLIGKPDEGISGKLETAVGAILGRPAISCQRFSLIKHPIRLMGGSENRARGAIGLFKYVGSLEQTEETLKAVSEVLDRAYQDPNVSRGEWKAYEVYTGSKWSQ